MQQLDEQAHLLRRGAGGGIKTGWNALTALVEAAFLRMPQYLFLDHFFRWEMRNT